MHQAERAVFDLRRGLSVVIRDEDTRTLIQPVETLDAPRLAELQQLAGTPPRLALTLTRHRLASIGRVIADEAASLDLSATLDCSALIRLALQRGERIDDTLPLRQASPSELAATRLLRRAQVVPAALSLRLGEQARANIDAAVASGELLAVNLSDIQALCASAPGRLIRISEARVPLAGAEDCRFVLFREASGLHEHVAILIGERDRWQDIVPMRLHSACLTGDIFGSQRCDCGEQLRRGIAAIHQQGGGVLLYLAQEGRGIGLGNKFRAYRLQDQGLDTIDADQVIGFSKDERDFRIAQQMLEALDIHRVTLLTNNPAKIESLRQAGIDVVNRQPIYGDITQYNQRYLNTKADRHGHWLHELLNEQDEPIRPEALLHPAVDHQD
ncbi:MAG: GTP cyclohydrolase II RibA [Rhodocyclaceae bacterium]